MASVILSPHLDDAVLSCWHLLTGPGEVAVINVFAGVPERLEEPAWWDNYTGATDSGARVRERVEEDRQALALAGRTGTNLDLLDEQYRCGKEPAGPLAAELEPLLPAGASIYAPAAFGEHADHALVRDAALALLAAGFAVSLYADLPHANVRGWPAWVTGTRVPATKDFAGAMWERWLSGTGISLEQMVPTVHLLDPDAHALKLDAVRAYRTQVGGLTDYVGRPLADREVLGYEVVWALPNAPTAERASASSPATPGL